MKHPSALNLEDNRLRTGKMASTAADGNNGVFLIPHGPDYFQCIVSDGGGWDHVSVVIRTRPRNGIDSRIPTWAEMCTVKDLFFTATETVVQYHPAVADDVNFHGNCLHLWRCQEGMPKPPIAFV